MKTTIVFDTAISGHHPEYLNHLHNRAGEIVNDKFIFVVHHDLRKFESFLLWPPFKNVVIKYLDENQVRKIEANILMSSFRKSMLLREYIIENKASSVFLVSLMPFLPFLSVVLNKNLKVSGIIYSIAARSNKNDRLLKRFLDFLKYLILSKSKIFDRIFLLNDPASARLMNRKYKCSVFHYLPDPAVIVTTTDSSEIKQLKSRISGKIVFLHFGGLSVRKGTVDILKSIELLDNSLLEKVCFIFAGYLNEDIKATFNGLVSKYSDKVQIEVFEGFCRYEFLGSLCSLADYLLLPYRSSSYSSGLLSFAAQFNLPVIGTSEGLLGSLIRSYRLGYSYKIKSPDDLAHALEKHIRMPSVKIDGRKYMEENTISNFQRIIFE
jgi:glycosyltransferase involved in cell wall biosynthesis